MPLNEADTRAKLIDPAIYKCGWTEDLIRREETAGTVEIINGKARRRSRVNLDDTGITKNDFILQYLTFLDLNSLANQMGQPVIAGGVIYKQVIALPPIEEQWRIAAVLRDQMAAGEKARAAAEEELNTINALPAAFLRRAFAGEL